MTYLPIDRNSRANSFFEWEEHGMNSENDTWNIIFRLLNTGQSWDTNEEHTICLEGADGDRFLSFTAPLDLLLSRMDGWSIEILRSIDRRLWILKKRIYLLLQLYFVLI